MVIIQCKYCDWYFEVIDKKETERKVCVKHKHDADREGFCSWATQGERGKKKND